MGLSQYKRQELLKNTTSEGIMDWEEDLKYVKYEL